MNKKLATAVAAVVIFGGGIAASIAVASAQTGSATTSTPAAATPRDHPDRGAAQKSALDPLVADGTITQAQDDKVLGALDAAHPKGPDGDHGFGMGPGLGADFDSIASALGVTTDQLKTDLKDGKSLADIATAQGVDIAKVEQAITDAATARLDDAVKSGKLTQDQADKIKAGLADHIGDLVNGKLPFGGAGGFGGKGHGPFGHGPGQDNGSSGSTTTTTN